MTADHRTCPACGARPGRPCTHGSFILYRPLIHTARVGQATAAEIEEAAAYKRKQEAEWGKMMDKPSPNVGRCWKCGAEIERGILCGDCSARIRGGAP